MFIEYVAKISFPKETKKKFICAKICVWMIAIITLSIFTVIDLLALLDQYEDSKPVTHVEAKDDSVDGIRLPNGTLCIKFYTDIIGTLNPEEFQRISNFSNITSKSVFYAIQHSLNKKSFISYYISSQNENNSNWMKEIEYDNQLAKYLCNLINVKLFAIIPGPIEDMKIDYDLCKLSEIGDLPLVYLPLLNEVDKFSICLRIPLNLFPLKQGSTIVNLSESVASINKNNKQFLKLSFQPMAIRKVFPIFRYSDLRVDSGVDSEEDSISSYLFFPEIGNSYKFMDSFMLSTESQIQFMHEMDYPNDINYMLVSSVKVQFTVNGKYTKIEGNPDCSDVHNGTACEVKCTEKDFASRCHCYDYENRQFIEIDKSTRFCTSTERVTCLNEIFGVNSTVSPQLKKCRNECNKCSRIVFQSEFSAKNNNLKKLYKPEVCRYFHRMTNDSADCDKFYENTGTFMESLREKLDNWEHDNSSTALNLFGNTNYEFSMKSFKYPEFVELPSISKEEFKSQIGGILGLYLGLSGMSAFVMIISFIELMKSRWKKRQTSLEKKSELLKFWRFLGIQSLVNQEAKTRHYSVTHF